MLLHLGGDVSIFKKHVTGIFDIDKTKNAATKEFLQSAKDEKRLHLVIKNQKVKSFVLVDNEVYLSPISSTTLQKRFLEVQHTAV